MERRALAVSFCVSDKDVEVLESVQKKYGVFLEELPPDLDPKDYLDFSA